MNQQKSKESLYNELLSTFDYSMSKKEKEPYVSQIKKYNNQNSTMSLFSMNNITDQSKAKKDLKSSRDSKLKKEKQLQMSTASLKDRLEYTKQSRKYSPEVDMNRLMQQKKQKINSELVQTAREMQAFYKRQTINQVIQSTDIGLGQPINTGTRNNSANTKVNSTSNNNGKKNSNQYNSEYNSIGNPKLPKINQKKRGSE